MQTALGSLQKPAGALLLVVAAVCISRFFQLGLSRDLLTVVVRAFLQLTAVGFLLKYMCEDGRSWPFLVAIVLMVSRASVLLPSSNHQWHCVDCQGWVLLLLSQWHFT